MKNISKYQTKKGKRGILDTSGIPLEKGLVAGPAIIKPNIDELETLLGASLSKLEDIIAGAIKLRDRGPEAVVVSLGSKGLLWSQKRAFILASPRLSQR